MNIMWGNWDVRVYAANAWVSLASRFASEYPIILERIEAVLADPVPSVRLKASQNLQVVFGASPDRMWAMGKMLAAHEINPQVLSAFLNHSLWRFSHKDPESCEEVLTIVKGRLNGSSAATNAGHNHIQEALGRWTAQLSAAQGRMLMRTWLEEWAKDPERYGDLLNSFASSLRGAFFSRYIRGTCAEDCAMSIRAQEGLLLILKHAVDAATGSYSILSTSLSEEDKQAAIKRWSASEKVIYHAMNQLYFGSGANSGDRNDTPDLLDSAAKGRFLNDYAAILKLLENSREPATLHHLIELYEFLMPGDPIVVFDSIHAIIVGRGKEEGYHYEILGEASVVRIIQEFLADHRAIFDDEGRRAKLVEILHLFSKVGWIGALRLLYDLPDLLR